jgi:hypothetical protein
VVPITCIKRGRIANNVLVIVSLFKVFSHTPIFESWDWSRGLRRNAKLNIIKVAA